MENPCPNDQHMVTYSISILVKSLVQKNSFSLYKNRLFKAYKKKRPQCLLLNIPHLRSIRQLLKACFISINILICSPQMVRNPLVNQTWQQKFHRITHPFAGVFLINWDSPSTSPEMCPLWGEIPHI